MKKYIIIFLSILAFTAKAQTMQDIIKTMPDSVCPYLTENNRLDLLDFIASGMKSKVANSLGDTTRLDTLATDYAILAITPATTMQLRLLPLNPHIADSLTCAVCICTTYGTDAKDSHVAFYSPQWQRLTIPDPIAEHKDKLLAKPDTMSEEQYDTISRLVEVRLVEATLRPNACEITLKLSPALINNKNRNALINVAREVRLKWNRRKFD